MFGILYQKRLPCSKTTRKIGKSLLMPVNSINFVTVERVFSDYHKSTIAPTTSEKIDKVPRSVTETVGFGRNELSSP